MKKTSTADRLKTIMREQSLRQIDILNKSKAISESYGIKMNKSDISQYVSGLVEPGQDKLVVLGQALNVSEAWLMGYDVPRERNDSNEKTENNLKIKNIEDILQIKTQKIPLIGDIACGVPNLAEENFKSYVELGADIRADFALRCHGDSMINARILDGDIVFIKKQAYINNGEIAAVLVEEEATLKRVYITETTITLIAENTAYPPIIIDRRDDSDMVFKILGKAVAFQSDVR